MKANKEFGTWRNSLCTRNRPIQRQGLQQMVQGPKYLNLRLLMHGVMSRLVMLPLPHHALLSCFRSLLSWLEGDKLLSRVFLVTLHLHVKGSNQVNERRLVLNCSAYPINARLALCRDRLVASICWCRASHYTFSKQHQLLPVLLCVPSKQSCLLLSPIC